MVRGEHYGEVWLKIKGSKYDWRELMVSGEKWNMKGNKNDWVVVMAAENNYYRKTDRRTVPYY